jgi:hypothetical protein
MTILHRSGPLSLGVVAEGLDVGATQLQARHGRQGRRTVAMVQGQHRLRRRRLEQLPPAPPHARQPSAR